MQEINYKSLLFSGVLASLIPSLLLYFLLAIKNDNSAFIVFFVSLFFGMVGAVIAGIPIYILMKNITSKYIIATVVSGAIFGVFIWGMFLFFLSHFLYNENLTPKKTSLYFLIVPVYGLVVAFIFCMLEEWNIFK